MKTKYIYILLLGLFSMMSTGCEDRLDILKHGNLGSEDDFYKTDNDALQASVSITKSTGITFSTLPAVPVEEFDSLVINGVTKRLA